MSLLGLFGKKDKKESKTYIHAVSHVQCGVWHQYDILLKTTIYGWEYMLNWADYMAGSDMKQMDRVTISEAGKGDIDITGEFMAGQKIPDLPSVSEEHASLGIAGTSNMARGPVKIVWFNQTRMLRIFTATRNDDFILKYVDTMVARSFGTKDQMKLLATDVRVEDLILAASGEFVRQTSGNRRPVSPAISETPEEYDAHLKRAASKMTAADKKRILSLIEDGQHLMAIKVCREATGEGLKYAKDLVDDYRKYLIP